nr:endonuclease III domain-containing protein [Aliarcobacter lanthieri]
MTQNTTFTSVVKSLNNLNDLGCLNYKKIKDLPIEKLKELIKPSGYNNQKANYILNFIEFFENLNSKIPTREELLAIKGIGFETADSILLYGYNQAEFKVDAYTKRLLVHNKLLDEKVKYNDIKYFMEEELKKVIKNKKELVITYQEYHALIVQHSKLYYSKQPYGNGCFLDIV